MTRLARWVNLETMIVAGVAAAAIGFAVLVGIALSWWARNFGPAHIVLPAVAGTLLLTLGAQTILGGFLLSIVSGHEARFLEPESGVGGAADETGRKAA